ncbi:MAG: hypothetical protein EU530_08460 [Promethearchaeota archaeon]|nr:MAG: hypothetical protein EU530_08460 [Candidatus Lokiarchaeota archaeon]
MSLTIDTLLKSQGEVHLTEIELKWYFTPQNDEENTLEIQGTYNIDSYYDSHTTEIQHPRTQVTGFYEIFNKLRFTNIATQSTFILGINHITEYEITEEKLTVEFVFHRSIPQTAFDIEQLVIAGVAEIYSPSENLQMLHSLIHKNLHLHFSDHVFKIPRCNKCSNALTIHNRVDLEDEVINEDFVCMDCYTVINNFYNILENEVFKITEYEQMKEQRDTLIKFLMTGKKNAAQIEETQLQHFYNLLIIYVEYLSGNLDPVNVLVKIQAVQTIGANQNLPLLQQQAEEMLNKFDFGPPEESLLDEVVPTEQETWTPPVEPEPTPPPLPMGTPSPATILPQDPVLTEGLQSLEEVQAELQSTLEALSQIESDLRPRPITPTDNMHAVNVEMENEEPDKIPTYDDIKETFSDLESIDFPDIQFGTDSSTIEEYSEEDQKLNQVQQNLERTPTFLNPPPSSTQDYQEDTTTPPLSTIPSVQELPPILPESEKPPMTQGLNPPPRAISPEEESSAGENFTPNQEMDFGDDSGYNGVIEEGDLSEIPLNPPIIHQTDHLNPKWRELSESPPLPQVTPPPRLNFPPQTTPPAQMNPPLQPVTPPPQMNPPPQVVPPLQHVIPPVLSFPPENQQIQESEEESEQDSEVLFPIVTPEPPKPQVVGNFFNNGNRPPVATQKAIQHVPKATKRTVPPPSPKPSPKETRAKRDRHSKDRRIICSFCGQTMTQGKKKCPNCGSFVN